MHRSSPAEWAGKPQELQSEVRSGRNEELGAVGGLKERVKDGVSCVFLELPSAAVGRTVLQDLRQR